MNLCFILNSPLTKAEFMSYPNYHCLVQNTAFKTIEGCQETKTIEVLKTLVKSLFCSCDD